MSEKIKKIKIKVVSVQGQCDAGHQVGQEFEYKGGCFVGHFCPSAFFTLYPYILSLQFGASFPWEAEDGTLRVACPDPDNPVVFKIMATE